MTMDANRQASSNNADARPGMATDDSPLIGPASIGQCATMACLLEATAPKPGNVHRGADFEDLTYLDFALSAAAIGPILDAAPRQRLGTTVLAAVRATRQWVGTNTNLGTVLLLTPLAMVPTGIPLASGIPTVLTNLDATDSELVYQAIRHAQPGGMGRVSNDDVADQAPQDLLLAMRAASERDLVARQYAHGFQEVLEFVAPKLRQGNLRGWPLADSIVKTQMECLAEFGDSLVARKCGQPVADQLAAQAASVLRHEDPTSHDFREAALDLDFWLRADGHRRNPGTTADLIAAGLFVLLREGVLRPPLKFY